MELRALEMRKRRRGPLSKFANASEERGALSLFMYFDVSCWRGSADLHDDRSVRICVGLTVCLQFAKVRLTRRVTRLKDLAL